MSQIELRQLTICFGTQKVVHDVSLDIACGQTLGLVGESGSGKSLTSLAIMGLLPEGAKITSGSIVFNGENLLNHTEEQLCKVRGKQIAMIFQEPMTALNPAQRCGEQIDEIIRLHQNVSRSEAKKQTLERLSEVLIPHPLEAYRKYPHQMSGGQLQRVMIAMSIACRPQLLIADEPTTALDVTVQREVLTLLKDLQQRYNMSMLFVSHDLGVVAAICERIAVMQQGKIVEEGAAKTILEQPQHPYTQHLVNCRKPVKYEALPQSKTPVLEVKNLHTTFASRKNFFGRITQHFTAVNNVSFQLFKGETLGLVGESGCGKSTLGRTIMQLVQQESGTILFEGTAITNRQSATALKQYRKDVQLIFQDPYSSLNPRMRIGTAIVEPMLVHGIAATKKAATQEAKKLLQKVGLDDSFFQRFPHELSGGQRQRVVIARALSACPQLIICDESVSALDVSIQAQVLQLLRDLQREMNLSYLFISHDLSVVQQISDRVMVMQNGNLVEMNTAQELFEHPKSEYTRRLIGAGY